MDEVLLDKRGSVGVLTLNQPERRNPLSKPLRVALTNALRQLAADRAIRSVILTGADPAFCSGMDLAELAQLQQRSAKQHLADAKDLLKLFETIRMFPLPLIAAVNGPAVAGGCGVALLADVIIAGPNASFAFSEVRIGFVPALVGVYAESLAGSGITREMLLSGRTVGADEAFEEGIVQHVIESHEQLLPAAVEFANRFAKCAPGALRTTKELLVRSMAAPTLESALRRAVIINGKARRSAECREGVSCFLEKRKPSWVATES